MHTKKDGIMQHMRHLTILGVSDIADMSRKLGIALPKVKPTKKLK